VALSQLSRITRVDGHFFLFFVMSKLTPRTLYPILPFDLFVSFVVLIVYFAARLDDGSMEGWRKRW
jgi:hypothetical protein